MPRNVIEQAGDSDIPENNYDSVTESMNTDDTYWARDKKNRSLIAELKKRRQQFYRYIESSNLFNRIRRSYDMYHDLENTGTSYGDEYAIKLGGEDNDQFLVTLNEFRSVLQLLKTYIVRKPEWDALVLNRDESTDKAAKLANAILDAEIQDVHKRILRRLDRCVEEGLVVSASYIWLRWNCSAGDVIDADTDANTLYYKGDIEYRNPSYFDVFYDFGVKEFQDSRWVMVKNLENKWDLIAEEEDPKKQERILKNTQRPEQREFWRFDFMSPQWNDKGDQTWVYYFYHKPTPALPNGRFVRFVGNVTLEDRDLIEQCIPVHRWMPSTYLTSSVPYSPSFDIQAPQEALNMIASTLVTNQNALGPTKIWVKAGEPINEAELEPGITILQTDTPPQSINMLQSAEELWKAMEVYNLYLEKLSGVNMVSRGQSPGKTASGRTLAILESRTQQQAHDMIQNYEQLLRDIGTSAIYIYRAHVQDVRTVSGISAVIGVNNRRYYKDFIGKDLSAIHTVSIVVGNPAMQTLAGRVEYANAMMNTGLIRTAEEYLGVIRTGNLERLDETNQGQLMRVHAENDVLTDIGTWEEAKVGIPPPSIADNHVFHILKHQGLMDSPENSLDSPRMAAISAHIQLHFEMLTRPEVQGLMYTLGYQVPPHLQGQAGLAPGGISPEGAGGPAALGGTPSAPSPMTAESPQNLPPSGPSQSEAAQMSPGGV